LTGFNYLSSRTKNFVWQAVVHKHGACDSTLPIRVDHYHRQAVQHDELRQDLRAFFQHAFKRNATEPIITRQQLAFLLPDPSSIHGITTDLINSSFTGGLPAGCHHVCCSGPVITDDSTSDDSSSLSHFGQMIDR
jgi:hypothetical protein